MVKSKINKGLKLIQVSIQRNKTAYFIYEVEVQRGIHDHKHTKAKEVLILGTPAKTTDRVLFKELGIHLDQIKIPCVIK